MLTLRPYHPSDLPALYRICQATGLNGKDAAGVVPDPDLIGHSYVGPYATLEPERSYVTVLANEVVGYVLSTADCVRFHQRCESFWFPPLRCRYPLPTADDDTPAAKFVRTIHRGHVPSTNIDLCQYPANFHIDVLPEAQRKGMGRRLLSELFANLRRSNIPGVHLYAARANSDAIKFYERMGFRRLDDAEGAVGFGFVL